MWRTQNTPKCRKGVARKFTIVVDDEMGIADFFWVEEPAKLDMDEWDPNSGFPITARWINRSDPGILFVAVGVFR